MTTRKLDEIASTLDDASTVVEELQTDPGDTDEKLDELHDTLEHASDTIDEIGDSDTIDESGDKADE